LTIAIIGIALSVFMFIRTENGNERHASETLARHGEELTRVVADLETTGSQQAEALEGLFEASTAVTQDEFDHFALVISGPLSSSLAFSSPVPTNDPARLAWPVEYEFRLAEAGFHMGFDLAQDPVLLDAIERAGLGEAPAPSGFIELPGDTESGDLAMVSSVTGPDGEVLGVALAIIQIDEALADRARLLLDDNTTWRLREVMPGEESAGLSTAEHWANSVAIGDRGVIVELDGSSVSEQRFGSSSDWLALLGIVTSALLAILAYNLMNRRSATRRIAKLEQTLAEKDQFLATVSHELRTPLTAVVGMLEVINDNLENLDPDQYAVLLGDARDGALELERLIEDYLTAARLSAGALTIKQEAVNLDTVFGRTIARLNLPETLVVTVDPLGSCVGDSLRIRQIARNILRNAARYADHQIQVRNVGDDSFVVIEIRNDGEPVALDMLEGLFEPFGGSPAPGRTEPIGLGLSVSRGLARRMGGDLRYSVDGQWTVFSVVLPIGEPSHDAPDSSKEPARVR
jgi:signal transduction histidine kinase